MAEEEITCFVFLINTFYTKTLSDILMISGQLSQRMQIPGNMWVEVWQSAKPVPARRQRRLFDDTKEAEKVCAETANILLYNQCAWLLRASLVKSA